MFNVPKGVQTRWADMENPDAKKGEAAKAFFGRKGSACRPLAAGESLVMAHSEGTGVVRRMWITIPDRSPECLRGMVIRMYWDGKEKPAVEVPLGDFFCHPHGEAVNSRMPGSTTLRAGRSTAEYLCRSARDSGSR